VPIPRGEKRRNLRGGKAGGREREIRVARVRGRAHQAINLPGISELMNVIKIQARVAAPPPAAPPPAEDGRLEEKGTTKRSQVRPRGSTQ
jgi:hypothetical protein